MTKIRTPLTFENALTTVAAALGWKKTARIVGRSENTVRNWSDNDTTTGITLEAALQLDVEYHKAGGEGAPFFNCYATLVESARLDACPEIQALIAGAAKVAKETGEAIEATLNAATTSSGLSDIAIAERELEEAINAHRNSLSLIRARKQHLIDPEGKKMERESDARAQGVAQPMQTA